MKNTFFLRKFIREVLLQEGPAMASGVDPTNVGSIYPETERGNDIHSFWYRSPGRGTGGDGDPGRPSNAEEYIGLSPKTSSPEEDLGMNADDVFAGGGETNL